MKVFYFFLILLISISNTEARDDNFTHRFNFYRNKKMELSLLPQINTSSNVQVMTTNPWEFKPALAVPISFKVSDEMNIGATVSVEQAYNRIVQEGRYSIYTYCNTKIMHKLNFNLNFYGARVENEKRLASSNLGASFLYQIKKNIGVNIGTSTDLTQEQKTLFSSAGLNYNF